jgi:DNA-binding response OmpR family regulator
MPNRVLIIDDDKELCALMKKCVEQENLSAMIAHGGVEGLRLADENKNSSSLSLVISDVMMPDIDGFQVLKMIRYFSCFDLFLEIRQPHKRFL